MHAHVELIRRTAIRRSRNRTRHDHRKPPGSSVVRSVHVTRAEESRGSVGRRDVRANRNHLGGNGAVSWNTYVPVAVCLTSDTRPALQSSCNRAVRTNKTTRGHGARTTTTAGERRSRNAGIGDSLDTCARGHVDRPRWEAGGGGDVNRGLRERCTVRANRTVVAVARPVTRRASTVMPLRP